jgi:hypothetical protein
MREYNQFEHTTRDHDFEDDYLFYSFVDKSKRIEPIPKGKAHEMSLEEIASAFENGVFCKNRKHRMRSFPNSFVGSEAVDFLVKSNLVGTRREAVQLGKKLATEYDLFQSADSSSAHKDYVFRDEHLLYTFIQQEKRKPRRSTSMWGETKKKDVNDNDTSESSSTVNLVQVSIAFEKGVDVRDHQYRLTTYRDSFVGSKAVDFLVNSSMAQNRREAVQLGRRLAQEFNLFRHVTGDHEFKDDVSVLIVACVYGYTILLNGCGCVRFSCFLIANPFLVLFLALVFCICQRERATRISRRDVAPIFGPPRNACQHLSYECRRQKTSLSLEILQTNVCRKRGCGLSRQLPSGRFEKTSRQTGAPTCRELQFV